MISSMLLALAAAAAGPGSLTPLTRDPQTMSSAEVRAYNTGRNSRDPDYVRCVREDVTGSLARRVTTCRTNAQWAAYEQIGNRNAREAYGSVPSASSISSN